ncbi:MAG: hypothetical protein GEV11_09350 [Streptosporangiales bacterium]|nr:hypothetical protein [Streptosporangiales bacterium]
MTEPEPVVRAICLGGPADSEVHDVSRAEMQAGIMIEKEMPWPEQGEPSGQAVKRVRELYRAHAVDLPGYRLHVLVPEESGDPGATMARRVIHPDLLDLLVPVRPGPG